MHLRILLTTAVLFACAAPSRAAEPAAYRTDGGDEKLPWFKLQTGQFPPADAAHAIAGELISLDHVNRTGVLRWDRTDAQTGGEYDASLPFALLPYGSVAYHGAPAELRDIPIGTHLHGLFFVEEKDGKQVFSKALRLEDDFSFAAGRKRLWRIDSLAQDKRTLTVTGVGSGPDQADAKPTTFQISPATRIWKGRSLGTLADLAPEQQVLLNLTVCTIKGPGRCTDIWIDAESREVAAAQQVEVHRQFIMEHGLGAWVDEVDNSLGIVTVTLFAGYAPVLTEHFRPQEHMVAAVAEETLRTHDQNNDCMRGPIVEALQVPPGPGNSGLRVRFKPEILLEGYRPQHYLRVFHGSWHIDDIPREERAYDG